MGPASVALTSTVSQSTSSKKTQLLQATRIAILAPTVSTDPTSGMLSSSRASTNPLFILCTARIALMEGLSLFVQLRMALEARFWAAAKSVSHFSKIETNEEQSNDLASL